MSGFLEHILRGRRKIVPKDNAFCKYREKIEKITNEFYNTAPKKLSKYHSIEKKMVPQPFFYGKADLDAIFRETAKWRETLRSDSGNPSRNRMLILQKNLAKFC